MKFQMQNLSKKRLNLSKLLKGLKKFHFEKEVSSLTVSVVYTTDKEISLLNKRFLKKNRPTDVIAFPLRDEADDLLGEVFVSVDTARRQALERGISLHDELLLLSLHGLLHLLGETDETLKGFRRMKKLEFENLVKML